MSSTPVLPEEILCRVPQDHQDQIKLQKQRCDDLNKTVKHRSVSDFLECRIRALSSDIDYIAQAHRGLEAARENSQISAHEFREALEPFLPPTRLIIDESRTITRQRKLIEEDLEEQLATKRQRVEGPGMGIYLRAYTSSILERVKGASGKTERAKPFDGRRFKADVNSFYGVKKGTAHCHLLGSVNPIGNVKAAHIVPKSLTQPEIAHLFGYGVMVESDPRNAVSLHMNIEIGLDTGIVVIVPIMEESANSNSPSRWKCVLIDENKRNDVMCQNGTHIIRWSEIDGKELIFLNENRPARRYLYFRFVITYILWKKEGLNNRFTSKVEAMREFWPTPGPYLRKSMLTALARNISGSNLPDTLIEDRTFEENEYHQPENTMAVGSVTSDSCSRTASILAAHDIQNALMASLRRACASSESSSRSIQEEDEEDEPVFEDCVEQLY